MTLKDFNKVITDQLSITEKLLTHKGDEYSTDTNTENEADRLKHFKKVAHITEVTQEQAVVFMMMKHIVSITDMVNDKIDYPIEKWEEKITDAINYLLILKAAVVERQEDK